MANTIFVIGESGTGKSTSIESLPSEQTFILNVINKELPFRGWKDKYKPLDKNKEGNYYSSDNSKNLEKTLEWISNNRPDIKYIIIDDYVYTMSNEFMKRADEAGFKKFTEIGVNAWKLVNTAKSLREDLNIAFLTHSEEYMDINGIRKQKIKTVGKLVDEKVNLEGMVTCVLYTDVESTTEGNKYFFLTENRNNTGKTPKGMFEEAKIPNDLKLVFDKIEEYNNG